MTLISDLKSFETKILATRVKWQNFIGTVGDPTKYAHHTKTIDDACTGVQRACVLIDAEKDQVKYTTDIEIKTSLAAWSAIDDGFDKVIEGHREE